MAADSELELTQSMIGEGSLIDFHLRYSSNVLQVWLLMNLDVFYVSVSAW